MRVLTAPVLAIALLAPLVLGKPDNLPKGPKNANFSAASHDHEPKGKNKGPPIKTDANLMGDGAKIQLCPTGDCANGQAIMLSMARLQEVLPANANDTKKPFVQEAKKFNALNATWTDFEALTIGGVDAMSSSFLATFKVTDQAAETSFNLTAVIYQANGTAMNGNQTIDVPAGALKFSVMINNWPFKDPANRLRFGVELKAQGKNKAERDPGTKKPKGGKDKRIDRLDMGEGMFMDAPTQAVVDGANVDINATVETENKKLELVWIFPSFTESLYYDPVMGAENASSTDSAANDTTNTSTTTTTTLTPTTNTTSSTTNTTTPTTTVPAKSSATVLASMLAASFVIVFGALLV